MPVTHNGTTFTTHEETIDLSRTFEELYGHHGDPFCHVAKKAKNGDPCSHTTEYVIEPAVREVWNEGKPNEQVNYRPTRPGVGSALMLRSGGSAAFIYHDGALYIPMKVCLRCSAVQEAWRDGGNLSERVTLSKMMEKLPEAEAKAFCDIYDRVYTTARNKAVEALEARANRKNHKRYAEK
jgi:hypothetical protein